MKTYYLVVKANDSLGNGTYSSSEHTHSIVRIRNEKLTVDVHGKKYEGKDYHELQEALSADGFPFIIEEFPVAEADDLAHLGHLYQQTK